MAAEVNWIFLRVVEGAYMVAFARTVKLLENTHEYIPAYTKDIERKLTNENDGWWLMDFAHISFLGARADEKPWHARQYPRMNAVGAKLGGTEGQTAFVRVLDKESDNTAKNRRQWGENLAKIFTALSSYKKKFRFAGDENTTTSDFLGMSVTAQDAIHAVQLEKFGKTIRKVLDDDATMLELFGCHCLVKVIRRKLEDLASEPVTGLRDLVKGLRLHTIE